MNPSFIDEVRQYLQANGITTPIYKGNLPDADGSADVAIGLFETTGLKPDMDIPTFYPSFQIIIRDTRLDYGQIKAQALRLLLHNKYNLYFVAGGTYVYKCNLTAQGGHIGQDEKGRDVFSLNFQCEVR